MSSSAEKQSRSKRETRSWDYVLRSGAAGGIAGCVAKTAIAPLDRVKILFQAASPEYQKYSGKWLGVIDAGRKIVHEQGILGLFQGHSATLLRIFPYAAVKYMAYDAFHLALMPTPQLETNLRLFIAGSLSGMLSVFFTYPLELIRVRLAFDTRAHPHKSLWAVMSTIYHEGAPTVSADGKVQQMNRTSATLESLPILKFYRGFTATLLGMIPYAGTSFLVFGRCKSALYHTFLHKETNGQPLPGYEHVKPVWHLNRTVVDLTAGALAGAISQTASYPLEVIRRRQQIGGIINPSSMMTMRETAELIYQTNGWRSFYVGLSIGYIKVMPMTAISFAVWSAMKRKLGI
ncbi:coenzyme A transporter [Malassezia psittaci]|uniref:Coenzyme A transporter n=1 Tax=Malassezia psittaci TaxID=1821823 RepID=A0AAF0F8A7_9BASI|nr:coenzyme A transporter [Malassezia psittaci]